MEAEETVGTGGGGQRRGREGRLEAVVRGATVYNSCHRPRANRPCPQLSQSCLNLTSSRLLNDQVSSVDQAKESRFFRFSRCNSFSFVKIYSTRFDGSFYLSIVLNECVFGI